MMAPVRLLIFAAIAFLPVAQHALAGTAPGSGVEGTAHDFSNGSGNVCSPCHTGNPADESDGRTYVWEAPTTVSGTPVPVLRGGPSARCLGCHDGTVGSGGVPSVTGTYVVGANGHLSGHHPVGLPYPLAQVANIYGGARSGRYLELYEWQPNPTALESASIRLFKDDGMGHASVLQKGETTLHAGIECSSCHDPHNNEAKDVHFLRAKLIGNSTADGFICKQCHGK